MNYLFHFYDLQKRAGIQRAICELANALVEHGDGVAIVTHSARSEATFRIDDRVVVEQTPYQEHQRFGLCAWPMRALWGVKQAWVLRKIIKRYRPQIVVDHGTALGLIYPFRKLGGSPFVMQRHFPARKFPGGKVLYQLLPLICGRRTIVVLTENIASELRSFGYKRVVVIPNVCTADAKTAPYRDAVPMTGLLMGRGKTPQKGFDIFLQALAMTKMPGWHFTIVGPEVDTDPQLRELVRKHQLTERVSLLPATDSPFELIRKTVCVIMPSRYEALPMVAIEALGIGRPVLASDVDGLRDVVIDDVNGLIFSRGDAIALSTCLARVRDDCALLERLAEKASASVEHFKGSYVSESWSELVKQLTNAGSNGGFCS
jgi:glycosyltransferase involved in cell wall biosynthesis